MKKNIAIFCYILLVIVAYSASFTEVEKQFLLGSIEDKISILENDCSSFLQEQKNSICIDAIDYALTLQKVMNEDKKQDTLLCAAFNIYYPNKIDNAQLDLLQDVFRYYKAESVRKAVLEQMINISYSGQDIKIFSRFVSLLNAFVSDSVIQGLTKSEAFAPAITAMGAFGNSTSFTILFNYVKAQILPEFNEIILDSLSKLSERNLNEVLHILTSPKDSDKYLLFSLIMNNEAFEKDFKADIAKKIIENALEEEEDFALTPPETLYMYVKAADTLATLHWTRGADAVTKYFSLAKKQYKDSQITKEQFITVINAVASLSSIKAGTVMAAYLNELNMEFKEEKYTEPFVVLNVINAISHLGDKSTFDYLLAVTYLDYPDNIKQAALDALNVLKW